MSILWIYREYIYYASYIMIPESGSNYEKTYFLVSLGESLAVALTYHVRLHVKRLYAFTATIVVVLLASLLSSFSVLG